LHHTQVTELPLIDDEYFEHVSVYQSVLRSHADRPYVVVTAIPLPSPLDRSQKVYYSPAA